MAHHLPYFAPLAARGRIVVRSEKGIERQVAFARTVAVAIEAMRLEKRPGVDDVFAWCGLRNRRNQEYTNDYRVSASS